MMPAKNRITIGANATCARTQGTLTSRRQALHFIDLWGPRLCFCQNEKVLRSHHGHSYIRISLEAAFFSRLSEASLPAQAPGVDAPKERFVKDETWEALGPSA